MFWRRLRQIECEPSDDEPDRVVGSMLITSLTQRDQRRQAASQCSCGRLGLIRRRAVRRTQLPDKRPGKRFWTGGLVLTSPT